MVEHTTPPACQNNCVVRVLKAQGKTLFENIDYFKCVNCEEVHTLSCPEESNYTEGDIYDFSSVRCNSCMTSTFYRNKYGNKHLKKEVPHKRE